MSEKEIKNLETIFDARIARDEKIEPKDGARVIQFPSGSIPTISEWACCEI